MRLTMAIVSVLLVFHATNSSLGAQATVLPDGVKPYAANRAPRADFEKKRLGSTDVEFVKRNLRHTLAGLQQPDADIILAHTRKSLIGYHYDFIQTYKGVPIYGAQIMANIDFEGNVWLLTNNVFDLSQAELPQKTEAKNGSQQIADAFAQKHGLDIDGTAEKMLLFTTSNKAVWVTKFNASGMGDEFYHEYLVDEKGKLVHHRDLVNHFKPPKQNGKKGQTPDAENTSKTTQQTISAMVFMPDPLTSSGAVYGQNGMYRDNGDADSPELTAERVQVEVEGIFEGGVYKLENERFVISEFSNPNRPPVSSPTPNFNFTRSESGFEDCNAFYHLNAFADHVAFCGFTALEDEQIRVDTHAHNGNDNSTHTYQGGKHSLAFGEGGVDDAEDADPIIHEYGHALSFAACFACNTGTDERLAIDEAVCDYFATSYSYAINPNNWENMFTWDGHNEFFAGRNMNNNRHYPEDLTGSIYDQSLIWSGVLVELLLELGPDVMDKLVLNSLNSYASGITMENAAQILLINDEYLFDGAHVDIIQNYLASRGLADYTVMAGADKSVCLGDTVEIGGMQAAPAGAELYWTPGLTLNDSTAVRPLAMPDGFTKYVLHVVDATSQLEVTDTVEVSVDYCFHNPPGEEIKLLNSDRFLKGRGNLIVELPLDTENASIEIYDAMGNKTAVYSHAGDDRLIIPAKSTANAGVYILKITADGEERTFKVGKVR